MKTFANIIPLAPYLSGSLLTPYHTRQVQSSARSLLLKDKERVLPNRRKSQVLVHPALLQQTATLPETVVRHSLFPSAFPTMKAASREEEQACATGMTVTPATPHDLNRELRQFFANTAEEGTYIAMLSPSGTVTFYKPSDGEPQRDYRDFQIRLNPDNTYTFIWSLIFVQHQPLFEEGERVHKKCEPVSDKSFHTSIFTLKPEQVYLYDTWRIQLPQPSELRGQQPIPKVQPDATKTENASFYYYTDKVGHFFSMQPSPVMFVLYIDEHDNLGFSTLDRPRKADMTKTASIMYMSDKKYSIVIPASWCSRVTLYKMMGDGIWMRVITTNHQEDADYYILSSGRFRLQGLEFDLPKTHDETIASQQLAAVRQAIEDLDAITLAILELKEKFIALGFEGHFEGGLPSEELKHITPHRLKSVLKAVHPDKYPEAEGLGKRVLTQAFVNAMKIIKEIEEHMQRRGIPGWAA
ncbi:MAG: hypothetical protein ABII18_07785 [bacterium]|nr:hypothetical protein [bacterium]MBU1917526.1 hypothetical protein [bacterium]